MTNKTTDAREGVCPQCQEAVGENYDTCPVCGLEGLQEAWNPGPQNALQSAIRAGALVAARVRIAQDSRARSASAKKGAATRAAQKRAIESYERYEKQQAAKGALIEKLNAQDALPRYDKSAREKRTERKTAEMTKELFAQDALQSAIESLGAVEVAPAEYGERGSLGRIRVAPARFAFKFGSAGRWWTASAATLALWWEKRDPNAGGCPFCVLMPAWWTPDARFAWRTNYEGFSERTQAMRFKSRGDAERHIEGGDVERITADLATGEEVPA